MKIFDENASATHLKSSKAGPTLNDGPTKKGLQQSAVKSARKALSNLNTNQINIRQTPAAPSCVLHQGPVKAKQVLTMKCETKAKTADEYYVDDFTMVRMSLLSGHILPSQAHSAIPGISYLYRRICCAHGSSPKKISLISTSLIEGLSLHRASQVSLFCCMWMVWAKQP